MRKKSAQTFSQKKLSDCGENVDEVENNIGNYLSVASQKNRLQPIKNCVCKKALDKEHFPSVLVLPVFVQFVWNALSLLHFILCLALFLLKRF